MLTNARLGVNFVPDMAPEPDLEPMMKTALGLEWRFASSKVFKRAYEKWTKNIA